MLCPPRILHPGPTHIKPLGAPAIGFAAPGALSRAVSPSLLRIASRFAGRTLRIDLHPLDVASSSHMLALEDVIRRARPNRTCVTYDDIASASAA